MIRILFTALVTLPLLGSLSGQELPPLEPSPDARGTAAGAAQRSATNPMVLIRDPATGQYRDANRDGVVDQGEQELADAEQRHLAQCLGTLRGGTGNPPEVLEAARQAVEQHLLAMFDLDLAVRKQQLAAVEQQVQQLTNQLAERERNRLELVKLRMLLLQQEFSGVAFPEGWQQLSELTHKGLEIKTNSIGMHLVKIPAADHFSHPESLAIDQGDLPSEVSDGARIVVGNVASFYLGQHEVTQGQWKKVMGTEPWKDHAEVPAGDDFPAVWVSHADAVAFCQKLGARESLTYRLPTLTEWLYAFLAQPNPESNQPSPGMGMRMDPYGMPGMMGGGVDPSLLSEYAWWSGNTGAVMQRANVHGVGLKRPNAWGLYDMPGNVREICEVVIAPRLSVQQGPTVYRAYAGGSWKDDADHCGFAFENDTVAEPTTKQAWIGFRIVLEQDHTVDSAQPTDSDFKTPKVQLQRP